MLRGVISDTELVHSPYFSDLCGNEVYLKPENLQVTGAYKIRGAYYKTSLLSEEEKARGLITASAGNHAQGLAYAAKVAGVKATVVMPTTTPLMKVNRTKQYGAEVILHGGVFDDAADYAMQLAQEQGLTYIPPFNDLDVACGQGTIAYEIFPIPAGCGCDPGPHRRRRPGRWRVHPGQAASTPTSRSSAWSPPARPP